MLRLVINDDKNEWLHFLSGQDILIKPLKELFKFNDENPTTKYIAHGKEPLAENHEWMERYNKYHFHAKYDTTIMGIHRICIKEITPGGKVIIMYEANELMKTFIKQDITCAYLNNFVKIPHPQYNAELYVEHELFCMQILGVNDVSTDGFEQYLKDSPLKDKQLRSDLQTYWLFYKQHGINENLCYRFVQDIKPSLHEIVGSLI